MSGRIPQEFINDLIDRVDLVGLVGAHVELRKAGRDYKGLCPFHQERTPSFTVSPDKGFYYCFGCGAKGSALTFLLEHDRMDFVAAVELLAREVGVEVPRSGPRTPRDPKIDAMREALDTAEAWFHDALHGSEGAQAREYLARRGVSREIAERFRLGWAPDAWDGLMQRFPEAQRPLLVEAGLLSSNERGRVYDRFRGRLMFPIRDARGVVVGFGGRVLGEGEPKYLNSPETPLFHKGRELYGFHEARRHARSLDPLLLVEGYMDVVALAQHGIEEVAGVLGTAVTPDHLQRIFRSTPSVVCCFDGDAAGRRAAWRSLELALGLLEDGRSLRFLLLPEGEDPDSLVRKEGPDAFRSRIAGATDLADFLFDEVRRRSDPASLTGRARGARMAAGLIERMPEGIHKRLLVRRLAETTGLGVDELIREHRALAGPSDTAAQDPEAEHAPPPRRSERRARPAVEGRGRLAPSRGRIPVRSPAERVLTTLAARPQLVERMPRALVDTVRELAGHDDDPVFSALVLLLDVLADPAVRDRGALFGTLQARGAAGATLANRLAAVLREVGPALGPMLDEFDKSLIMLEKQVSGRTQLPLSAAERIARATARARRVRASAASSDGPPDPGTGAAGRDSKEQEIDRKV